jgi:actin-related protein
MTKQGVINNWEGLDDVFVQAFDQLEMTCGSYRRGHRPVESPLILIEPTLPGFKQTEINRIMSRLANRFAVSRFTIINSAVAAMYASGRETGVLVECGICTPWVVPIHRGRVLAVHRFQVSPDVLTKWMKKLFIEKYQQAHEAIIGIERNDMEALAYVAHDFAQEMLCAFQFTSEFRLTSGYSLRINDEPFQCGEALFNPALAGIVSPGVHTVTYDAIMACDVGIHEELFANIVLSSSNRTVLRGFAARLEKEVNLLHNASTTSNVGCCRVHSILPREPPDISDDMLTTATAWPGGPTAVGAGLVRRSPFTSMRAKGFICRNPLWELQEESRDTVVVEGGAHSPSATCDR